MINAGVLENADIFRMINIFSDKFAPSNLDKADGTPLRLYTSDRVKVDVFDLEGVLEGKLSAFHESLWAAEREAKLLDLLERLEKDDRSAG